MRWIYTVLAVSLLAASGAKAADSGQAVDLALVLAVDVSASINDDSFHLQMGGYAAAFADPDVITMITKSGGRGIAVTLVEWSSAGEQMQIVPWTLITSKEASEHFAGTVHDAKRVFYGLTSISEGIEFSAELLRRSGFSAMRRVIDVSGDGPNNSGEDANLARDRAVKDGIVINGLPILRDAFDLKTYYHDNVVGGVGAFVQVAKDMETFPATIRYKIIKEVSQGAGDTRLGAR